MFRFAKRNQIQILNIEEIHLLKLSELELIHKGPFDRIIISQAITENLTLLTQDKFFKNSNVEIFWK